jgi:hypothetical protein
VKLPSVTKNKVNVDRLVSWIKNYAPHLEESHICDSTWWEKNWGRPETHVRPPGQNFDLTSLLLTPSQMFKHLINRGIGDIFVIFKKSTSDSMPEVRASLARANKAAAPVWNDSQRSFGDRRAKCEAIWKPVSDGILSAPRNTAGAMPSKIVWYIDEIFNKYYHSENYHLIGRADEESYGVQEQYANEVSARLASIKNEYGARALVCLGKAYGRSSIPLLSESSVGALWDLCCTSYYQKQLSVVSLVCLHII